MKAAMLRQLEQTIQQHKSMAELGESFERLKSNRDFKRLVTEDYFEKEAIRLVHAKSDVALQSADSQKSVDKQIEAIGTFAHYLNDISSNAELAKKSLAYDEATREEILAEGE